MKTLLLADVQSLHFEAQKENRKVDFVLLLKDLQAGYGINHAIAYTQPTTPEFERILSSCGFELVICKSTHVHQLCMDAVSLAPEFDHVLLLSTRYYLLPLIHRLKRSGKVVTVVGLNTPQHIQQAANAYADVTTFIGESSDGNAGSA